VNGAGKTTTFKSLTADVIPSSGEIFINSLNVANPAELREATKLIGYCPQFDAVFEGMTVLEHIEFYARIKGVLPSFRERLINKMITEMDLDEFRNVQV
jgi:ATP-binding cassette, subfamily A (ABC1), member 3